MTDPDVDLIRLTEQLTLHEACKDRIYTDTRGNRTIGIGHNLENGLSRAAIDFIFLEDVREAVDGLDTQLPWWRGLDEVRRRVLIDLCFNLGIGKLRGFQNTLAQIKGGRYGEAAASLQESLWAHQVGDGAGGRYDRGDRLAEMLRTGLDYTK